MVNRKKKMSTPTACSEQLKDLGQTFKILRATPRDCDGLWVAAAKNQTIVDECGGIVGTPSPSSVGYVSWGITESVAVADSTILVVYDAVTGHINYGISQSTAEQFFGTYSGVTTDANCLYGVCGETPIRLSCSDTTPADGVLQFIAQLCAAPAISYFGDGLTLTVAKPTFLLASSEPTCPASSDTTFAGCSNWKNFSFNIGACGKCTADVDLVYIGSKRGGCSDDPYDCSNCELSYELGNTFIYAPTRFTLANRDGSKASFKKACFIKIEPLNECFNVFFAQTRNCNEVDILIISCLVDLSCLYWGASVYIITSPRARYKLPF